MASLLKKQEEERKDLASGVYDKWQPVKEKEDRLLSPFGGDYDNAPEQVKKEIIQLRNEFYAEWGSEGRLAVSMSETHRRQREKLAAAQTRIENILNRNSKDKDRGR